MCAHGTARQRCSMAGALASCGTGIIGGGGAAEGAQATWRVPKGADAANGRPIWGCTRAPAAQAGAARTRVCLKRVAAVDAAARAVQFRRLAGAAGVGAAYVQHAASAQRVAALLAVGMQLASALQ